MARTYSLGIKGLNGRNLLNEKFTFKHTFKGIFTGAVIDNKIAASNHVTMEIIKIKKGSPGLKEKSRIDLNIGFLEILD